MLRQSAKFSNHPPSRDFLKSREVMPCSTGRKAGALNVHKNDPNFSPKLGPGAARVSVNLFSRSQNSRECTLSDTSVSRTEKYSKNGRKKSTIFRLENADFPHFRSKIKTLLQYRVSDFLEKSSFQKLYTARVF